MSIDVSKNKSYSRTAFHPKKGERVLKLRPARALAGVTAVTLAVSGSMLLGAVPAQAATPTTSQASAQYLSGSLLGISLSDLANLQGVQTQASPPGNTPVTQKNNLDLSVLGNTIVLKAANGIQIPLDFTNAGVLGQYSTSSPDGSSTAATGLVSGDGTIGTNPDTTNPPGPLTLDLSNLLGADVKNSIGNLTVTADATTATATDKAPAAPTGTYQIAGTDITFTSPAIAALSGNITTATVPLQNTVNGVVGPNGSLVTSLTGLLGTTGTVTATSSVNLNLNNTVATVLGQNQVLGGEGPVTINLSTGKVNVDIKALLTANGQDLNNLPANTELLSPAVLNLITNEVDELLTGLTNTLNQAITAALNAAVLNLKVTVANPVIPGTNLLDVSLNGTLQNIANGTTTATVNAGPAALVNTTIRGLINPLLNLNLGADNLLAPVRALYPALTTILTPLISLKANGQTTANGKFTETALQLSLLNSLDANGNALQLNLAQASVGPNAVPVAAAPTVTSFTPTSGPEAGGTKVTITGTGFTGTTGVTFGGKDATNYTVVSDTTITAATPAGTGTVPVAVTNATGTGTSPGQFTYIPANAPANIFGFTPTSGPEAGGTKVTITGNGFTGTTGVAFGGNNAPNYTVDSDNQITVTAPAGTGAVPIIITPAAEDADSIVSNGDFTYIPTDTTAVVNITPTSGPEAGGTIVTITGGGFTGADNVLFGSKPAADFTVNSDTTITATTPAGTGSVPVTVTGTANENVTAVQPFTYIPANTAAITSFTPTSGPEAGGTQVTVEGSGFTGTTGATFGGKPATNVTVLSDTELVAATPSGTGSVPVTITGGPNGDATAPGLFTYIPAGTTAVTGFTPTSGPEAGGTIVTITGSGFTGTTGVTFGNTPATDVTVANDNTIIATSPAGTGAVPIVVLNDNSNATSDTPFTYIPANTGTILGFTPTSGPEAGGTVVTITGSGFTGTTGVTFGGKPATNVNVLSDTTIVATTPAGTGAVPVTIIGTPGGNLTADEPFNYVPAKTAVITGFTPTSGPEAGGTIVTITGSGLTGADSVTFGGKKATNVNVLSDTTIVATTPAGTGTVPVTVTGTVNGNTTADMQFTYIPANTGTIITFTPTSGPTTGGTPVTITGSGFTGATGVTFGNIPAADYTVVNDTTIVATSPAGTGAVPITVTGTASGNTTSTEVFTYTTTTDAPTVAGFTPTSGPTTGGTVVTITGTGLAGTTGVTFNGNPGTSVTVNSDNTVTVTTPPGTAGNATVVVTSGNGNVTAADPFTYIKPDAPTITGITPNKGTSAGGTTVVITGTGYTGATGVTFGGVPATGVTVNSPTQITATTPAGDPGAVDVTVTTPNGNGTAPDGYTYVDPNGGSGSNGGTGTGTTGGNGSNGGTGANGGNGITTGLNGTGTTPTALTNKGLTGAGNNGAGTNNGNLAYTGSNPAEGAIWAILLLLSGAALLITRRIRRHA